MNIRLPESEIATFMRDEDAKTILLQSGLKDRLDEKRPTDGMVILVDHHHPTHWLLFVHISGQPVASENGYMVTSYPKKMFAWDKINALIRSDLKRLGIDWTQAELEDVTRPRPPVQN